MSETAAFRPWPRQMRAETAAAYCDEVSVEAFRRGIPALYPAAHDVPGKGDRWLIEELDEALDRLHGKRRPGRLRDLVG